MSHTFGYFGLGIAQVLTCSSEEREQHFYCTLHAGSKLESCHVDAQLQGEDISGFEWAAGLQQTQYESQSKPPCSGRAQVRVYDFVQRHPRRANRGYRVLMLAGEYLEVHG